MSDDQYGNRLLQYVRETSGSHGQARSHRGRSPASVLDRLKTLASLASKRVHDDVTAAEAETCVVWTYLLGADQVRLADGTSALLAESSIDSATVISTAAPA